MSSNFSIAALMKNRIAWIVGLGVFFLTVSLAIASRHGHDAAAATSAAPHVPLMIAGPGRVEPFSEDIKIGSELSGRLKAVKVEEGDTVRRGQVLAELENA